MIMFSDDSMAGLSTGLGSADYSQRTQHTAQLGAGGNRVSSMGEVNHLKPLVPVLPRRGRLSQRSELSEFFRL